MVLDKIRCAGREATRERDAPCMDGCAADEPAKDVAAPLVGGQDARGDQEPGAAEVVREHVERPNQVRVRDGDAGA